MRAMITLKYILEKSNNSSSYFTVYHSRGMLIIAKEFNN